MQISTHGFNKPGSIFWGTHGIVNKDDHVFYVILAL